MSGVDSVISLAKCSYYDLHKYLLWADRWYGGSASAIAGKGKLSTDTQLRSWFTTISAAIGRTYPTEIPEIGYRVAQIEKEAIEIGKVSTVQIGPRSIMSFSESKGGALKFYEGFLRDHGRLLKGHAFCLVSTPVAPSNYVTTYDAMVAFCKDARVNSDLIFKKVRAEKPQAAIGPHDVGLNAQDILGNLVHQARYQELLLSFKSPTVKVHILQTF